LHSSAPEIRMGVSWMTVPLRPKLAVACGLMLMSALAWLLLAGGAHAVSMALMGHGLPDPHDHANTGGGMVRAWGAAQWLGALLMWLIMAVAMMLPTAAPAILSFADAGAETTVRATLRQTSAFVLGYLLVWWSFAAFATGLQWLLANSARRLPAAAGMATALTGCLLLLAGLYQFSSLKRRCLAHCHGPIRHFQSHWRADSPGAHQLGLRHGLHCLGCCWALMLLMVLGGAMSIAWTAALAALILVEKALPGGLYLSRAVGLGLVGWGSVLIAVAWT